MNKNESMYTLGQENATKKREEETGNQDTEDFNKTQESLNKTKVEGKAITMQQYKPSVGKKSIVVKTQINVLNIPMNS